MKILINSQIETGIVRFFSSDFEEEYLKRTKRILSPSGMPNRELRANPDVIALVEEKGIPWSSGIGCTLAIVEIPDLFEKYWTLSDLSEPLYGCEEVVVDVNEAYADLLHVYMADGNAAQLADGYRRIRAAAEMLPQSQARRELFLSWAAPTAPAGAASGGDSASDSTTVRLGTDLLVSGYLKAIAEESGYGFFDDGKGDGGSDSDGAISLPHD